MSGRNLLSARDRNFNSYKDYLPDIRYQRYGYPSNKEPYGLAANTNSFVDRNVGYSFEIQPYVNDSGDRVGTPFSDFFSESETGTPDLHSEESDSSTGSAFRQNTAVATRSLALEWDRIERTIYDEEGEKTARPQMLEECKQWRELHPQMRVVGKAITLPEKKPNYRQNDHEEVIAMHYSDYELFSESEERLSESSTDVTPQNSPRVSIDDIPEPKLYRERVTFQPTYEEQYQLPDSFCSLLHITPMQIRSPRKRLNSSILKSEINSSRWMRNCRPDSTTNSARNSAKSFVSLDTRNFSDMVMSASERNKEVNRVVTARPRELAKLEPLYTPELPPHVITRLPNQHFGNRKVSLPPLLLDDSKKSINSAKKVNVNGRSRKSALRSLYHMDGRFN